MNKKNQILHVAILDPIFIRNFIRFIQNNFSVEDHKFLLFTDKLNLDYKATSNVNIVPTYNYKYFLKEAKKSSKIIFHGLWIDTINDLVNKYDFLLNKIYWIAWGGDFNPVDLQTTVRKNLIKKIKNIVTDNYYDYLYIREYYFNTTAKHFKCFSYPSNIFHPSELSKDLKDSSINILIGNSADPFHRHDEILKNLKIYKNENIKIFVPLSYCKTSDQYIEKVLSIGGEIFGEKFVPILDFMSLEEYRKFLSTIDIAIFGAKRQQAMGNIITLLGFGKKVYIDKETTTYKMLSDLGVKVFDLKGISITPIEKNITENNSNIIRNYFSEENLVKQWTSIFED